MSDDPDNSAQQAIAAERAASNAAIATRDAQTAAMYLDRAAIIVASTGEQLHGPGAMQAVFERMFADESFHLLVRHPVDIMLGTDFAAEHGRWEGRWGSRVDTGTYMARWRRVGGRWMANAELYVRLSD